jgi:hypothetical protein
LKYPREKRVKRVQMEEEMKGERMEAKTRLASRGTMPKARKATRVVMADAIGDSSGSVSIFKRVETSFRSLTNSFETRLASAVENAVA